MIPSHTIPIFQINLTKDIIISIYMPITENNSGPLFWHMIPLFQKHLSIIKKKYWRKFIIRVF